MKTRLLVAMSLTAALLPGTLAFAVAFHPRNIVDRCKTELDSVGGPAIGINSEHQRGRHAWAIKCGYIAAKEAKGAEEMDMVWSFIDQVGHEVAAPWVESAPCYPFRKFAMCPLGCFSSTQRVLFGSQWLTMEEAASQQTAYFTSLAQNSSPLKPAFARRQRIAYFTAGEEEQPLRTFSLADGKSTTVTQRHPMIDASGVIIAANDVKLGTALMTVDGPSEVITITTATEPRKVWHLRPESDEPLSNVVIAEGIMTGSQRFQSSWADAAYRNILRESLDAETVESFQE